MVLEKENGFEDRMSKVRQCAELVPTPIVSPSVSKAIKGNFRIDNSICIYIFIYNHAVTSADTYLPACSFGMHFESKRRRAGGYKQAWPNPLLPESVHYSGTTRGRPLPPSISSARMHLSESTQSRVCPDNSTPKVVAVRPPPDCACRASQRCTNPSSVPTVSSWCATHISILFLLADGRVSVRREGRESTAIIKRDGNIYLQIYSEYPLEVYIQQ